MDSWFTVENIDDVTFAISEYGHWEKVHSYLLIGTKYALLIDTGLGIGNIKKEVDKLTYGRFNLFRNTLCFLSKYKS